MSTDRQQWFIDRIGKRVYRNSFGCHCMTCVFIHVNGLIIEDTMHALYLCDTEAESNAEGYPLRYCDTIEERDEFVKSIKI